MAADDPHFFSAEKIFVGLCVFTALEVGWGVAFEDAGRLVLWGGLIFWAWWKFYLIAVYFMHLKWEGWIVKGLLVPTPFFVLALLLAVNPDVGSNSYLQHEFTGVKLQHFDGYAEKGRLVNMVEYDNSEEDAH